MKQMLTLCLAFALPFMLFSQDGDAPDYKMVELVHIKVKPGSQDAFEKAVTEHNKNHHPAPHTAALFNIATGKNVGTYVWELGPCTFTQLDSRPNDEAHDSDWDENVVPYIASVDRVEYWKKQADLSHENNDVEYKKIEIWWLELKRGDWYRFKSFMQKVAKVHENMNDDIGVWTNQFNEDDGRDVAITWPFVNWSYFDEDDWKMKDEFDKEYGEGAWENALEEWRDVVKSVSEEVWSIVN